MRNKLSSIYSCTKLLHHVFCYGRLCAKWKLRLKKWERRTNKQTTTGNWIEECSMAVRCANAGDEKCESFYRVRCLFDIVPSCDIDAEWAFAAWMSARHARQRIIQWKYFQRTRRRMMVGFDEDRCRVGRSIAITCDWILHCTSFGAELIYFLSLSNLYLRPIMYLLFM